MSNSTRHEVLRFLFVGTANTAVTYAVYLVLLSSLGYALAYSTAFAIGIALAYVLNAAFVFRVRLTMRGFAFFPLVYVAQYATGIVTLQIAVGAFGVPQKLAPILSIAVTIPVTFLLSRLLLNQRAPRY